MVDTKMTKSAAEHWVCSMLARTGWAAALTRDGIERTDILAVKADDSRQLIEVQVKGAQDTGAGPNTSWMLNEHAQQVARSGVEWFVLVVLPKRGTFGAPRSFIVPRDHLSAATWFVHQEWLLDPDVVPGKRNTPLKQARVPAQVFDGYEDRWDLLKRPTAEAPILLKPWLRDWADLDYIGWPPSHPWAQSQPDWR